MSYETTSRRATLIIWLLLLPFIGCNSNSTDSYTPSARSLKTFSFDTKTNLSIHTKPNTDWHAMHSSEQLDKYISKYKDSHDLSCTSSDALQSYKRYIEPLLEEGRESSCSECHLGGSLIQSLVYDTPCETLYCWDASGVISLEQPKESLLLSWIQRADDKVPEHIVNAEREGFLEWIEHHARCGLSVTCPQININRANNYCKRGNQGSGFQNEATTNQENKEEQGDQGDQEDDMSHTNTSTPLHSVKRPSDISDRLQILATAGFDPTDAIDPRSPNYTDFIPDLCAPELTSYFFWTSFIKPWHGRCKHCHVEGELLASIGDPPHWLSELDTLEGAEDTLSRILQVGYLDFDDPENSLLILKPLSENLGGVRHGGGPKFIKEDDPTLYNMRGWARYWADCISYREEMQEIEGGSEGGSEGGLESGSEGGLEGGSIK
jgi:hypothetical protein